MYIKNLVISHNNYAAKKGWILESELCQLVGRHTCMAGAVQTSGISWERLRNKFAAISHRQTTSKQHKRNLLGWTDQFVTSTSYSLADRKSSISSQVFSSYFFSQSPHWALVGVLNNSMHKLNIKLILHRGALSWPVHSLLTLRSLHLQLATWLVHIPRGRSSAINGWFNLAICMELQQNNRHNTNSKYTP